MSMSMSMDIHNHNHNHHHHHGNLKLKTELCRRFREGACFHGSKCKYAHGVAELRQGQPSNKLCRLFLRYNYKHCPYGGSCRFLHSSPSPFPSFPNPQPPPQHKMMATNASTTTVPLHKDEPPSSSSYSHDNAVTVKSILFNKYQLQKISGIYADWI